MNEHQRNVTEHGDGIERKRDLEFVPVVTLWHLVRRLSRQLVDNLQQHHQLRLYENPLW
jgi:hypothetical protein